MYPEADNGARMQVTAQLRTEVLAVEARRSEKHGTDHEKFHFPQAAGDILPVRPPPADRLKMFPKGWPWPGQGNIQPYSSGNLWQRQNDLDTLERDRQQVVIAALDQAEHLQAGKVGRNGARGPRRRQGADKCSQGAWHSAP